MRLRGRMASTAVPDAMRAGVLLRDAWDLVRRHPVPLALPLVLLGLLTSGGEGPRGGDFLDPSPALPWYSVVAAVVAGIVALVLALVILAVLLVLAAILMLLTTRMAFAAARGEPMPTFGDAFQEAKPRVVPATLALLLGLLLVVLGLVLLIIPGILVLGALLPLFAVLLRETTTSTGSISRAWRLSRPHLLDLALVAAAGVAVMALGGLLLGWLPLVGDALSGALGGLVQAVWIVVGALFYERRLAVVPADAAAAPLAPPP